MARVLVIGSGGREHALACFLARGRGVEKVYSAPGNAGTANNVAIDASSGKGFSELAEFAESERIDLTVVGPETPLCAGIADFFRSRGLPLFGPGRLAARLEGDKAFARRFMARHGIPHPEFQVFEGLEAARKYLGSRPEGPVVVKAAGLAAGKGVVVCVSLKEAEAALELNFKERAFGEAGDAVVIEELLEGEEASILAICDGERAVYLPSSQDHKRAFDKDAGPNTGGMGAYAPAPVVSPEVLEKVDSRIVRPVLAGMAKEGEPYRGCLYVGLMVKNGEPTVVEFNCRFGDPETQAVLPLLNCDFYGLLLYAARGDLEGMEVSVHAGACCTVVLASGGYPGTYQKGKVIEGLEAFARDKGEDGVFIFHAGTARNERGEIITSGGRVLGVTALGPNLREAIGRAYQAVERIRFEKMSFRRDIGHRALARLDKGGTQG